MNNIAQVIENKAKANRQHRYMVEWRDSIESIVEKIAGGVPELIERDWQDALQKPVWLERARFHWGELNNKFTEARIVDVETGHVIRRSKANVSRFN